MWKDAFFGKCHGKDIEFRVLESAECKIYTSQNWICSSTYRSPRTLTIPHILFSIVEQEAYIMKRAVLHNFIVFAEEIFVHPLKNIFIYYLNTQIIFHHKFSHFFPINQNHFLDPWLIC